MVNWKIEASGPEPMSGRAFRYDRDFAPGDALKATRDAYFPETGIVAAPVYDRYRLAIGASVSGPAIIEERESTTVIDRGDTLTVDEFGCLVVTLAGQETQ